VSWKFHFPHLVPNPIISQRITKLHLSQIQPEAGIAMIIKTPGNIIVQQLADMMDLEVVNAT
jgi:hypothetical protein